MHFRPPFVCFFFVAVFSVPTRLDSNPLEVLQGVRGFWVTWCRCWTRWKPRGAEITGEKKLGVSWLLGFKGLGLVNIFFFWMGSSLLHIVKKGKEDRQRSFFFSMGRGCQSKIAEIKLCTRFWKGIYAFVKQRIENTWELPMIFTWPMLHDMQITRGP